MSSFWQRMTTANREVEMAEAARSAPVMASQERREEIAEKLATTTAVADVPIPERIKAEPSEEADILAEYERLAKEIGFKPAVLRLERLRTRLAEMGLYIYQREKVDAYLTSKFGVEKAWENGKSATWCWRPLRDKDRTASGPFTWVAFGADGVPTPHPGQETLRSNGMVSHGPTYDKPVPMPVLQTIANVIKKVPDAKFFVSDETTLAERFRDPFLAVQLPGGDELYVIERWDEPSFRG